jgi:hypothetical protein
VRMPFGKFKGHAVDDLPRDDLEWLADNVALREPLASAVQEALGGGSLTKTGDLPPELKPVVSEIVSQGYRTLAQKCHPDAGGDHRQMIRLNQARDWLRKVAA